MHWRPAFILIPKLWRRPYRWVHSAKISQSLGKLIEWYYELSVFFVCFALFWTHLHAGVCVQGCCSEAEAQQAGRMQTTSQPIQCELPTIPVQIGSHFLKGVSFNESAAENLKLKTVQSLTQTVSLMLLLLVIHLTLPWTSNFDISC